MLYIHYKTLTWRSCTCSKRHFLNNINLTSDRTVVTSNTSTDGTIYSNLTSNETVVYCYLTCEETVYSSRISDGTVLHGNITCNGTVDNNVTMLSSNDRVNASSVIIK